jgi:hypothetical protein
MDEATNGNGFFLTLGAAAKQAGLSKSTLSRAIRLGKLSAIRCPETNSFKIDPVELHRYCDAVSVVRVEHSATADDAPGTPVATAFEVRCAVAEARLEAIERQLADRDRTIGDLREDRDHWRDQAERLGMVLPKPQPAPVPEQPRSRTALARAWLWLRTTAAIYLFAGWSTTVH